jgi:hypothetical protein
MTKGEKYRAYYQKNREKILAANRARSAAYREKLKTETNPVVLSEHRQKIREAYRRRRASFIKDSLMGRSKDVDADWALVYQKISTAPDLEKISKKTLEWLLGLSTPSQ